MLCNFVFTDPALAAVRDLTGDFRLELSPITQYFFIADIIRLQHIINKLLRIVSVTVRISLAIHPCINGGKRILRIAKSHIIFNRIIGVNRTNAGKWVCQVAAGHSHRIGYQKIMEE